MPALIALLAHLEIGGIVLGRDWSKEFMIGQWLAIELRVVVSKIVQAIEAWELSANWGTIPFNQISSFEREPLQEFPIYRGKIWPIFGIVKLESMQWSCEINNNWYLWWARMKHVQNSEFSWMGIERNTFLFKKDLDLPFFLFFLFLKFFIFFLSCN